MLSAVAVGVYKGFKPVTVGKLFSLIVSVLERLIRPSNYVATLKKTSEFCSSELSMGMAQMSKSTWSDAAVLN